MRALWIFSVDVLALLPTGKSLVKHHGSSRGSDRQLMSLPAPNGGLELKRLQWAKLA